MGATLNSLVDNRSDPIARAVLGDYCTERGWRPVRLGVAIQVGAITDAAAADADAAAAADADADVIKRLHQLLREEPDMRNGLKIIAYLPGRYGYGLTRIGWLRRVAGDEYEPLGARTIWRSKGNYQMGGLNRLAADGLGKEYEVSEPDAMPEELHRLLVRRSLPANEEKWSKLCPKPKGWVDQ